MIASNSNRWGTVQPITGGAWATASMVLAVLGTPSASATTFASPPMVPCQRATATQASSEVDPWISESLKTIRSLEADWDGYGADPINETTIKRMEYFLNDLLPKNAVSGSIVPGADGSLQAEWHLDNTELGFVVEPTGEYSSWVRDLRQDVEIERVGLDAWSLFHSVGQLALA